MLIEGESEGISVRIIDIDGASVDSKDGLLETDGRPLGIKLGAVAIVSKGLELGWLIGPVLIEGG